MTHSDKFEEIHAPAHWASALINGDYSGLELSDVAALNNWLYQERGKTQLFYCVNVSDETFIARFRGLQTVLATYTFQVSP